MSMVFSATFNNISGIFRYFVRHTPYWLSLVQIILNETVLLLVHSSQLFKLIADFI